MLLNGLNLLIILVYSVYKKQRNKQYAYLIY